MYNKNRKNRTDYVLRDKLQTLYGLLLLPPLLKSIAVRLHKQDYERHRRETIPVIEIPTSESNKECDISSLHHTFGLKKEIRSGALRWISWFLHDKTVGELMQKKASENRNYYRIHHNMILQRSTKLLCTLNR